MSFKTIKCSDIIDVRDGTHDSPKYLDKGYPLITSKNIMENSIDFQNVNLISEEDYNKINMRSSVKNGDILMPMIGTVGNPVLVNTNEKFAIKNVALFKLSENSEIDGKYFYYLLMSDIVLKQLEKNKRGGTQSFVSLKNLRELKIPYIGIEKQKKIVSILDKSKGVIDKRKEQIELLDELVKSRFIEMFGNFQITEERFDTYTLSELIDKKYILYHLDGNHGGLYPRTEEFVQSGVPYIGANCINNGVINFNNAKYLTEERADKFRKGIVQNKDVLFAHNATVGPVAILNTDLPQIILSTSLTAYRCDFDYILPEYLKGFMESQYFVRQYSADMSQTTRNQVPITVQRKYKFIIPPIEFQNQFADFVKQVDKLKFEMEESLKELEDNFNSLMQKAFKGELF